MTRATEERAPLDQHVTPLVFDRRGFLRLAARCAAASSVFFLPPSLRMAPAQGSAPSRADRILILNFFGGIRSSAAFHASPQEAYNPWGLLESTGNLRLGKLLGDAIDDARLAPDGIPEPPLSDAAYTLGPNWQSLRLPRIAEVAPHFSVVGTWNEGRGDHQTSQTEETTGGTRNDPGILTRIHMALASTRGEVAVPPFTIDSASSTLFGIAPGATVSFAPVELANANELPGVSALPRSIVDRVGGRWTRDEAMFESLDRRSVAGLAGSNLLIAEAHAGLRRNLRKLGARLAEPWMNIADPEAAFGYVDLRDGSGLLTNAMLVELFFRGLGPDPTDPSRTRPLPAELAGEIPFARHVQNLTLAIRLLQLGAPVVVVEIDTFDLHSDEITIAPPLYRAVARWWASLAWLLSRLDDPLNPSGKMLDRTLVATMSDFGRDPAPRQGFNDGDGSDHGAFPSCYYLAHAVMGAGITGGRIVGDVETSGPAAYDARRAPLRFSTQRFLATLLDVLGLNPTSPEWGFPDGGAPISQLWDAV